MKSACYFSVSIRKWTHAHSRVHMLSHSDIYKCIHSSYMNWMFVRTAINGISWKFIAVANFEFHFIRHCENAFEWYIFVYVGYRLCCNTFVYKCMSIKWDDHAVEIEKMILIWKRTTANIKENRLLRFNFSFCRHWCVIQYAILLVIKCIIS